MHIKRISLLQPLFGVLLLLFSGVLTAANLTAVTLKPTASTTEVTLTLSADSQYRYFGLTNPDRLVLDITTARSLIKKSPRAGGVIKKIRMAPRGDKGLRVVFDLSGPVSAKVSKQTHAASGNGGIKLRVVLQSLAGSASTKNSSPPPAAKPTKPPRTKPAKLPAPAVVKTDTKTRRPVRVVVDAGHGGKDTGAIGPSGTREKDVALAVASRLYQILKDSPDFAPVLSRNGDKFLKLRQRTAVARDHKADAFVSVHANSFTDRSVRGGSVYALSVGGATSEHARWLAERENSADLVGGVSIHDKDNSLASVLLDLSQTATLEASLDLASHVLTELAAIGPLHKKQVQQAGFLVLKSPDIPSVLVETAYISNRKEERKLRDARYQQKLANAIFRGLRDFFVANPPPGTLFAQHGGHYMVRRGDTLSALAQRWGTSVKAIRNANKLRGNGLEVGQQLIIP